VQKQGVQKNNLLALVGLIAIIFSIFFYDETTPFPSVYALVPVLGVVLIVLYAEKETIVAKLLSTKGIVGIGLISYSAYLWHQPLFAFARINSVSEPGWLLFLGLSISSLFLAFLSWRYIETPYRRKERIGRNGIFIFSFAGLAFFAAIGYFGHKSDGFSERESMSIFSDLSYDNTNLGYTKCNDELDSIEPKLNYCFRANEEINNVLFGDSHADDKFHGIVQNVPSKGWMLIGNSSCPPLMKVNVESADGTVCSERLDKIFKFLNGRRNIERVVLSFAHMYPLDTLIAADHIKRGFEVTDRLLQDREGLANSPTEVFEIGLRRTIAYLREKEVSVVLLTDIPELVVMPEDCLANKASCEFSRIDVLDRQKVHRDLLSAISRDFEDVFVFDSLDVFCGKEGDTCSMLKNGRTLYRDSHHLSHFGSVEYGKYFADFLAEFEK